MQTKKRSRVNGSLPDALTFFQVGKNIFDREELNAADKLVICALAYYAKNDTAESCPTITTIAKKASVRRSTVELAIPKLELLGVIKVDRTPGKRSNYTLLDHRNPSHPF